MSNTGQIVKSLLVSVAIATGALTSEVHAGDSADEVMRKVLREQNRSACRTLGVEFVGSEIGIGDPSIFAQVGNCYISEARLHVLGERRQLVAEGVALSELPIRLIADKTGFSLDPYRPLAGHILTE